MKKLFFYCCMLTGFAAAAQETISTMFYNLYRFPDRPPASREYILKQILEEYHPDLFMVCELVSEEGADRILNTAIQTPLNNFSRAAFVSTLSDTTDPLQQLVYYNKDKFRLLSQHTYPTTVRDINHYTFVLNTPDIHSDSVYLEVFVTHLKSSEGNANRLLRSGMIDTFRKALDHIPADHFVLLAGDFNFYGAAEEPAYGKLLDTAHTIVMADPINRPGNWSNNDTFRDIHTQASRTSSAGFGIGGATGGLDDRFDFILVSQNLQATGKLQYVPDSYKAFGNNGNCFNERVDHYDCEGPYSLELRQRLHNMSDHLPVVLQLKTSKQFLSVPERDLKALISFLAGNIATDFLEVMIKRPALPASSQLLISDNLGQVLYRQQVTGKEQRLHIFTGNLAPGLYYLRCPDQPATAFKVLKR